MMSLGKAVQAQGISKYQQTLAVTHFSDSNVTHVGGTVVGGDVYLVAEYAGYCGYAKVPANGPITAWTSSDNVCIAGPKTPQAN